MRILLAHNDYARPSGEEHAVRAIARLLEQNQHDVHWFLRSSADIQTPAGQLRAFFSGIYSPKAKRELGDVLDATDFDLVQVQNLFPLLSPSILAACKQRGVPVVMRCPNYRLFCPTGLHFTQGEVCQRCVGGHEWWCVVKNCDVGGSRLRSFSYAVRAAVIRVTRSILDNVDLFLVLSEFQRQRFIQGGIEPERIRTVPNIVPAIANPAPYELGELVTFVGRVSPEKGIEDFVAAARRLPELPFAVAGSHESMRELVQNSPGNVQWLGFLDEPRLNDLYRRSRILVFPSRWFEGFPNVIPRAMLYKKPIVACRIGGLPEIVDHDQCGLLFDPQNIDQLVDAIRALYEDPSRCRAFGEAGHAKATTSYSEQAVYRSLMMAYADVLNSRPDRQPLT